jgi:hypothetical protein
MAKLGIKDQDYPNPASKVQEHGFLLLDLYPQNRPNIQYRYIPSYVPVRYQKNIGRVWEQSMAKSGTYHGRRSTEGFFRQTGRPGEACCRQEIR